MGAGGSRVFAVNWERERTPTGVTLASVAVSVAPATVVVSGEVVTDGIGYALFTGGILGDQITVTWNGTWSDGQIDPITTTLLIRNVP